MVQVHVLDPQPLLHHAEVVRRNGATAGYVRAGSYGHTLGGAVGLAMVSAEGSPITPAWVNSGQWTVEIAGQQYPARASLRPLHDPENARIKG